MWACHVVGNPNYVWYEENDASTSFPWIECVEQKTQPDVSVGNVSGFLKLYRILRQALEPVP